jgi:hypothetical protein
MTLAAFDFDMTGGLMKYSLLKFVGLCSLVFTSPAFASSASGGYSSDIAVASNGHVWFIYTGTLNGTLPACADPNGLWTFDASTLAGQNMLAALLSASARHQKIGIQGTGVCMDTHETIAYLSPVGQ